MENKYQQGKIYKITSSNTGSVYIGSTIQPLQNRLLQHKHDYNQYFKGLTDKYFTSFKVCKYDDCIIELLEEYTCYNKKELERREGMYIRSHDCCNKVTVGRTNKEYRESNRQKINQRNRLRNFCECGGIYRNDGRSRHIRSKKHKTFVENNK